MADGRVVKPVAILLVASITILAGIFTAGTLVGGSTGAADGERIQGQSPPQYQPDQVATDVDPETGTITAPETTTGETVVIDVSRSGDYSQSDLEALAEALFEAGHTVEFVDDTDSPTDFDQRLSGATGLLVVQPTEAYPERERDAIEDFADDGGNVVVLAEPTRTEVSGGPLGLSREVSFGATELTSELGFRIGSESLYNMDDEANDNNFRSIYASPTTDDGLTEGVDTVTFDRSGYVTVADDNDADVLYTAAEGTQTLESRQSDTYPVVARDDNVVFVADASFVGSTERYDADNEVFIGNLLGFLVDEE